MTLLNVNWHTSHCKRSRFIFRNCYSSGKGTPSSHLRPLDQCPSLQFIDSVLHESRTRGNPFLVRVIERWRYLIVIQSNYVRGGIPEIDLDPVWENFGSGISRINLPKPEKSVLEYCKKKYSRFSWLPDQLDINTAKVRAADRIGLKAFTKYVHISEKFDHAMFVDALIQMLTYLYPEKMAMGYFPDATNCEVVELDEAIQRSNSSSNSCYPVYKPKGTEAAQTQARSFISEYDREDLLGKLNMLFSNPITLFHRFTTKIRSASKTHDVKIRHVFGYPFGPLLAADMVHGNTLNNTLIKKPFSLKHTYRDLSNRVNQIREVARVQKKKILSLDISLMDKRQSCEMMLLLHALLIELMEEPTQNDIDSAIAISIYELHGAILGKDRRLYYTMGGTKSGTRFNTFTNCLSMLLVIVYSGLHHKITDIFSGLNIEGDDITVVIEDSYIASFCQMIADLGYPLNVDKTTIAAHTDTFTMLGREWDALGRPDRDMSWVLGKLCYPEKSLKDDFYAGFLSRSCSIVFSILKGAKLFHSLILGFLSSKGRSIDTNVEYINLSDLSRRGPPARIPLKSLLTYGFMLF